MSIIGQLSSQLGDRTEYSNRKVVLQCLENPALLDEIAHGLQSKDRAILADCAEVMTGVSEIHPEQVVPHARALATLLNHSHTRVRWEAMHSIANIATLAPKQITPLLPQLGEMIRSDASVITRDYAVEAIARYAGTGRRAAQLSFPYLSQALSVWNGKQAGHALNGLANVAARVPSMRVEIHAIAEKYIAHPRGVVRTAARRLARATA